MSVRRQTNQQEENLSWIQKYSKEFSHQDIIAMNLRPLKQEQVGMLKQSEELLSATLDTFNNGNMEQFKFILTPNILLRIQDQKGLLLPPQASYNQNSQYLSLSECTITQKMVTHKQLQAFVLILTNSIGSTYLIFGSLKTYRSWYKQLKLFCKLTGFMDKYKLGEKIVPGFFVCTKKNKKTQYTVQIYKLEDFEQFKELEDAVHNEIQILRSIKHQYLLDLKRVYENQKYLFIVYEYYKGESLFKIFNSNIHFHEVQIASIVYQILSALKFLHQHQFYHGSINPQNILINTQQQMLQITLINISFKEYKVNDKLDWIFSRAIESFLAPEIFEGIAPNIQTDLYSVGCILYFMSFYDPKKYEVTNEEKDYYNVMDNFEINYQQIESSEKELSKRFQMQNTEKPNTSSSQLDLLRKLLEPQLAKRMTIKEATKHHWFVNVKNKIKSLKVERKRKKPLPSLRTIIELREQSEMEIRMTIIQQQSSNVNALSSKLSLTPQQSKRTLIPQMPSKLSQFVVSQKSLNSHFDDEQYDIPDEELSLEVPIIAIYKRKYIPKRRPSNIFYINRLVSQKNIKILTSMFGQIRELEIFYFFFMLSPHNLLIKEQEKYTLVYQQS
ncbi:hypothetical protein pb186bvf_005454 [Paramecium bursaria]